MINISIIIPIYKVEKWIKRCLLSVCNQTYANIECIIVNDATPDKSMDIVESILKGYVGPIRFKIIAHEKNQGLSAARNSGIEVATGDYLFFLDSDDELYSPDDMEILNVYIEKYGEADFFIGDYEPIGFKTHLAFPHIDKFCGKDVFFSYIQGAWPVVAWAKFVKRSFFIDKKLFFEKGLLHEDVLFSFRLAYFATYMVVIPKKIYRYYNRDNSIMSCKRYKNYLDNLYAISENYKLCVNMQEHRSVLDKYFVSTLFCFLLSVYNNKILSYREKEQLHDQAKSSIKKWNIDFFSMKGKMKIEYMLLNSNYYFALVAFSILRYKLL